MQWCWILDLDQICDANSLYKVRTLLHPVSPLQKYESISAIEVTESLLDFGSFEQN
jgi:hypothetical protein